MKILLTGATGFFGVRLIDRLLEGEWDIISLQRSASPLNPRVQVLYHDFRAEIPNYILEQLKGVSHILHLGAEVHGLRSLANPELFVHTNVLGTFHILEACRKIKPQKFIYMSSGEAVGSAPPGISYCEDCALNPSNPYAATKAAGEALTQSYARSFGVPAIIARTMNVFGERQKTGKFIPDTIRKMLMGEIVTAHINGSRQWLHVRELVRGLEFLLNVGQVGEIYHIVGTEKTNVEIIDLIGAALRIPFRLHSVVPGRSHDTRYCIRDTKIGGGGYRANTVSEDLRTVAQWYKANAEFLQ